MKPTYEKNCEYYTKALVLAVTAPTEEYSKECACFPTLPDVGLATLGRRQSGGS